MSHDDESFGAIRGILVVVGIALLLVGLYGAWRISVWLYECSR